MTNPFVDESLIDTARRAIADETVSEDVPAADDRPRASRQDLIQMMTCFVRSYSSFIGLIYTIPETAVIFWKQKGAGCLRLNPLSKH